MNASGTRHQQDFDSNRIILVALMFAFSVMSYFDRTIMSIAGPEIMMEFGIAPTHMGSIYSAFIFGYFLFMIPGGQLARRSRHRIALEHNEPGRPYYLDPRPTAPKFPANPNRLLPSFSKLPAGRISKKLQTLKPDFPADQKPRIRRDARTETVCLA